MKLMGIFCWKAVEKSVHSTNEHSVIRGLLSEKKLVLCGFSNGENASRSKRFSPLSKRMDLCFLCFSSSIVYCHPDACGYI